MDHVKYLFLYCFKELNVNSFIEIELPPLDFLFGLVLQFISAKERQNKETFLELNLWQ